MHGTAFKRVGKLSWFFMMPVRETLSKSGESLVVQNLSGAGPHDKNDHVMMTESTGDRLSALTGNLKQEQE
ncbi:MAG: hypothetical protein VB877_02535 [Pirellulaceae bacterium]